MLNPANFLELAGSRYLATFMASSQASPKSLSCFFNSFKFKELAASLTNFLPLFEPILPIPLLSLPNLKN